MARKPKISATTILSIFQQKQTVMRGPTHVKRKESEEHPFETQNYLILTQNIELGGPLKSHKRSKNEFT